LKRQKTPIILNFSFAYEQTLECLKLIGKPEVKLFSTVVKDIPCSKMGQVAKMWINDVI